MSFQGHGTQYEALMAYPNLQNNLLASSDDSCVDIGDHWESSFPSECCEAGVYHTYGNFNGQSMHAYMLDSQELPFKLGPEKHLQESYSYVYHKAHPVTQALPFAPSHPGRSPSPPTDSSPSVCSSARSPSSEQDQYIEYYQCQPSFNEAVMPRSMSVVSHGLSEPCYPMQSQGMFLGIGHINLSDVQTIPGPGEFEFQDDEQKPFDFDGRPVELERHDSRLYHNRDGGLSQSPKLESSSELDVTARKNIDSVSQITARGTTDEDEDVDRDADADLEDDDVPLAQEEEDQDKEWNPRNVRSTKRRRPTSVSSVKHGKIHKIGVRTKNQYRCKSCSFTAKDPCALSIHAAASHTRPYICAFSFAGCTSTFASKNEWKRHVTSQHLCLHYWTCEPGSCESSKHPNRPNEFNRKDLFTQHLRRMHLPVSDSSGSGTKRQKKDQADRETRERELQESSKRTRRDPPQKAGCPLPDCTDVFEGPAAWDDRMEHVAKHLERAAVLKTQIDQGNDAHLREWALRERIIGRAADGGWEFRNGVVNPEEDEDAEGEEE